MPYGSENRSRPGQVENPELATTALLPRTIGVGFDRALMVDESMGGNAGLQGSGVNATYENGDFILGNSQITGKPTDVSFLARFAPNFNELRILGKVPPPPVIEKVELLSDNAKRDREYIEQRVLQHNALKIEEYLRLGGDRSLIPDTQFMPDIDLLLIYKRLRLLSPKDQGDLSADTEHAPALEWNLRGGKEMLIAYEAGMPILLRLGPDQSVNVGKAEDLGYRSNVEFLILDPVLYGVTDGEKGFKGIEDEEIVILGRNNPGRFEFGGRVSGEHVSVTRTGEEITIKDLNSLNGTRVEIPQKRTGEIT